MSRGLLHTTVGLAIALVGTACSHPGEGSHPTSIAIPDAPSQAKSDRRAETPASIGWQAQARTLAAAGNMSPLAAARVYAALSVAQYRAVLALNDSDEDSRPSGNGRARGGRSSREAERGAVAGASAQVLTFFFPAAAAAMEQRVTAEGEDGPGNVHPQFTRGLGVGRTHGNTIVERTRNDRFTTPWTGTVPTGPGMWVANGPPAGATFGGVKPYFLTSADQFRPPPPPGFGSTAFLADLAEIKTFSVTRTRAQDSIAHYWNFPTGTFTPPGYWNLTTANYIEAKGLGERAATHAFALVNTAMMDSFIGCWEAKYHYWTLRPSQADPSITMSFGLPNHPSYPSGHSCSSAAAGTVLTYLFPDRRAEVNRWVAEAGLSRKYAGIHYQFDITAGQDLGNAVGRRAITLDRRSGFLAAER